MCDTTKSPAHLYFFPDSLFIHFAEFTYDAKDADEKDRTGSRFITKLNEQKHPVKVAETSYRAINVWSEYGLLEDMRDKSSEWRRFSVRNLLWIELIVKLRMFGIPLEKIKKAKDTLFFTQLGHKPYPLFEFYIALVLMGNDVKLIMYPCGEAHLLTEKQLKTQDELFYSGSYLTINFNEIVQKVFKRPFAQKEKIFTEILTEPEMQVINAIRDNRFENIEIKMNDGKIALIEATEPIALHARLSDLLKDKQYQEINIKQQKGNVVSIKRRIKTKTN